MYFSSFVVISDSPALGDRGQACAGVELKRVHGAGRMEVEPAIQDGPGAAGRSGCDSMGVSGWTSPEIHPLGQGDSS